MGNLATMYQMISAAETKPEILAQVEEIVLPAIALTLEKQMLELVDDVFDLTDMLTFYQKKISPGMWKLYELMHASFMDWAADYLENMISTMDNFVSFGADVFRTNDRYRSMLAEIFATATHSPKLGPMDHLAAYKLADVMLLVLKGCWDAELGGIIETVLPNAIAPPKSNDAKLRKWAEIVILDALIYNAQLTLQILESKGATGAVLDAIASRVEAYSRVHESRACICAFINILALGPANMPQSVQERAPKILGTLIIHLANMPNVVRRRKELSDILEDISDDEDEVGVEVDGSGADQDFGDDADVRDKETEYMDLLAEEQLKLLRKSAGKTAEGDDDEDDEWDEDLDDDDEDDDAVYDSPLDHEQIYDAFRNVMQTLQTSHPDAFTQLTNSLPTEQQQALHTVSQMKDEDLLAIAAESDDEDDA